jgi:hypothetical protein
MIFFYMSNYYDEIILWFFTFLKIFSSLEKEKERNLSLLLGLENIFSLPRKLNDDDFEYYLL